MPAENCCKYLYNIRDIAQEHSFETIYQNRLAYRSSPHDHKSLELFDALYRKYIQKMYIVYRYERHNTPLPRPPHSRQTCDNYHRGEVHRDN